jgi:hypothetical protein
MQIDEENIENMFVNTLLKKKNLKIDTNPKIHLLVAIYSGMG